MSIKVVWEKENFNETLNEFSFRQRFTSESCPPLLFAEFNQGIKFSGVTEVFTRMYFTDFDFDLRRLNLYTPKPLLCDIAEYENLVIRIVDPIDEPLPDSVNPNLVNLSHQFYASIFYQNASNVTTPLNTIKSDIFGLYDQIKSTLSSNGLGEFCICLGIKTESHEKPELLSAIKFYEKTAKVSQLRYSMVIIVNSTDELSFFCGNDFLPISSAPAQLQPIIIKVAHHLNLYTGSKALKTICRRIINCCFNGGVPVDILNRFEVLTGSTVDYGHRTTAIFPENLTMQHVVSDEEIASIKQDFVQQIHNFMKHLRTDSSEAQYRSLFWDQFISTCFFLRDQDKLSKNLDIPYKLQTEWPTRPMFPNLKESKVDYVAIYTGRDLTLMVLLVEAGKESFGLGVESHKDFSKLLAIMCKTCTKMAVDLEKSGRKAEDAVVIGAWIGGHQIHFVIAKPVITSKGNVHEVTCNLYFPDKWKFDLLSPKVSSSTESPSDNAEMLTLSSTGSDVSKVDIITADVEHEPANNIEMGNTKIKIESDVVVELTQCLSSIPNCDLNEDSDSDEAKAFYNSLNRNFNQEKLLELYEINYHSMCMVRNFLNYAYDNIEYFNSSASDRKTDVAARDFMDPSSGGVFFASRTSAADETPHGTKTHETSRTSFSKRKRSVQVTERTYSLVKSSDNELKIYQQYLQLVPSVFPQLYFSEPDPRHADATIFHFEDMEPLIYPFTGTVNELLGFSDLESGLKIAIWMILDLLHCLNYLHSIFGLVHSDISPGNIMFSEKYNVWKLNDFDQTMPIKQSIVTQRIAGTRDYIAPESIETSIFTFESDVYSLGVIFRDFLYFSLMRHVVMHEGDEDVDENLVEIFYVLEKLILDMASEDVTQRISVISAIKGFMELVKRFKDYKNYEEYQSNIRFFKRLQSICENSSSETEIVDKVETETETRTRTQFETETVKVYDEEFVENFQILKTAKL